MRTKEEILNELEHPQGDYDWHHGLDIDLCQVNKENILLATLEVLLDIQDLMSSKDDV